MKTKSIAKRFELLFFISLLLVHALPNAQLVIPTKYYARNIIERPDCATDPCRIPAITSVCNVDISSTHTPYAVWKELGGSIRKIVTNGIPAHLVGIFPILEGAKYDLTSDQACACGRPFEINEKSRTYTVSLNPGYVSQFRVRWIYMPEEFGIAINGVEFEPTADEWFNNDRNSGWEKNALLTPDMAGELDCNNAHVQNDCLYHYHGMPTGLYESLGGTYPWKFFPMPNSAKTVKLGYAKDGRPVYGPTCYRRAIINWWKPKSGYVLRTSGTHNRGLGNPPGPYNGDYDQDYEYLETEGDLDQCNGHIDWTPDYPNPIYHYHITMEFPYIPRCLRRTWKSCDPGLPEENRENNRIKKIIQNPKIKKLDQKRNKKKGSQ